VSQGIVPLTVDFSGQATVSALSCSGSVTYDWDFGDGSTHSNVQNPVHTYATAGAYNWTLTSSIGDTTCIKTGTITVTVVPPAVSSMTKLGAPFRIKVYGSNLQEGLKISINGQFWGDTSNKHLVKWKSSTSIVIKKGPALKALVPKNTSTTFRFVNPDGGEATVTWQWP
jgi:PKD repeat protein